MSELYYSRIKWKRNSTFYNKFVMLKGMSSSTPPMLNNIFDTEEFVGGGFYFNWQGYGVVIDPGYYFIKNLHRMGLSVLDIDAVVITHEHIDHNNDMRLLDDLHYSVARYSKQNGKAHVIDWYMDKVSYDIALTWRRNGAGLNAKANNLHCLASDVEYEFKVDELFLETCPTKHIWNPSAGRYRDHTVGTKFRCRSGAGETVIVYTSDTRYYPELADFVRDADAVIANISGIYEEDYKLVKEKNTHLGYYGCFNLMKECFERHQRYPSFYFLSEFWNGKSDIRYDVAKCLRKDLNAQKITQIRVIPAEVGMIFDIEHCKIQCSRCGAFTDRVIVKKPGGMKEKVEVLCPECCF
ncbi:MAG: MBL fold metallo-hydrolase [bacterium]|nr:MBL fold metallo-hydrolase [bacterium]